MTLFRNLLWSARWRAVRFTSTRPSLYYGLRRATKWVGRDCECVVPDTDIVIEGYPRSCNSWAVVGFVDRQPPGPLKLAHHKHHAAQLLRAVQWGIPAVKLIREPKGAVLSWIAMREEEQHRNGLWFYKPSFTEALGDWIAFYRAVLPYCNQLVIAPFEEVKADIPHMIRAVNARFGTSFAAGPLLRKRDFTFHALPNALRNQIKCGLEEDFERKLERSHRLRNMLDEANALHREILMRHESSRVPPGDVKDS